MLHLKTFVGSLFGLNLRIKGGMHYLVSSAFGQVFPIIVNLIFGLKAPVDLGSEPVYVL